MVVRQVDVDGCPTDPRRARLPRELEPVTRNGERHHPFRLHLCAIEAEGIERGGFLARFFEVVVDYEHSLRGGLRECVAAPEVGCALGQGGYVLGYLRAACIKPQLSFLGVHQ